MPFTLDTLAARRPFAFHVCGGFNLRSILATRTLRPARELVAGTVHEHLLRGPRRRIARVQAHGLAVELRDNKPLLGRQIVFPPGYTLDNFVDALNARVFFWAGTAAGPVRSGCNHLACYAREGPVFVLRMPLRPLVEANPGVGFAVSFCNTGTARRGRGGPVRRGPEVFVVPAQAQRRATEVVELSFEGAVRLPPGTGFAPDLVGPWEPLPAA